MHHVPDLNDPIATARLALACLDLTSLGADDTDDDIVHLCERAQGRHGAVVAVCVWPRFAARARRELPATIAVAAVANFPDGGADIARALRDVQEIVAAGAQEVDVVLPFERLRAGDERAVTRLLDAVRSACDGLRLKVILETGVLAEVGPITRAAQLALAAGADFLKTSTGKRPVGATPMAAEWMLRAIAADPASAGRVGFKAAGGIRTVADAAVYLASVRDILGAAALGPQRVRIGASSLLDDILAVLGDRPAAGAQGSY